MSAQDTHTDPAAAFAANRPRLWSVAYRMLGSRADAEDVVQDAYLRWHGARAEEIRTPQAWLVTTVTRLSIDRLRQLRAERERYTGPWLPEPLVGEPPAAADESAELESEVSVALLAVLERLAPEERAAFLLRETLDTDYGEIARILRKSEAACRQIVSRAAKRVRVEGPRRRVSAAARSRLLDGLVRAIQSRDGEAMLQLLAPNATWTSDGGGEARAARKQLRGAVRVARFAVGVYTKIIAQVRFRPIVVNGEPGLAVFYGDRLMSVLAIRTDGRRIQDVYSIMNPRKLRRVQTAS
jgi:RNA polymerase sigma-70 factor (ECF subfamily)